MYIYACTPPPAGRQLADTWVAPAVAARRTALTCPCPPLWPASGAWLRRRRSSSPGLSRRQWILGLQCCDNSKKIKWFLQDFVDFVELPGRPRKKRTRRGPCASKWCKPCVSTVFCIGPDCPKIVVTMGRCDPSADMQHIVKHTRFVTFRRTGPAARSCFSKFSPPSVYGSSEGSGSRTLRASEGPRGQRPRRSSPRHTRK